jgi:hypothetical protein
MLDKRYFCQISIRAVFIFRNLSQLSCIIKVTSIISLDFIELYRTQSKVIEINIVRSTLVFKFKIAFKLTFKS